MKIKILVGVLLFLIAVNLATIGSYVYLRIMSPQPEHIFNREFRRVMMNMRRAHPPLLRLNMKQRRQLFKLLSDFRRETAPQRRQINILERETFKFMQESPVPMDSVNNNLKRISSIRYEISQKIIKKMMAAKSYLSPRQQHEFYNAIMRARDGRAGPMHPPRPPGIPLP